VTARLVVLASGSGTNLQAVIDACRGGVIDAEVVHVITNRADAFASSRAREADITSECRLLRDHTSANPDPISARRAYDASLARAVGAHTPDLVLLSGWMHLLSAPFLDSFAGRVVNLHPALPGVFPGAHAIDDAWAAHLETGLDHTGVMVHLVPNEGIDDGPVLMTRRIPILDTDTRETLEERIHEVEHEVFVEAIAQLTTESS